MTQVADLPRALRPAGHARPWHNDLRGQARGSGSGHLHLRSSDGQSRRTGERVEMDGLCQLSNDTSCAVSAACDCSVEFSSWIGLGRRCVLWLVMMEFKLCNGKLSLWTRDYQLNKNYAGSIMLIR